MLTIIAVLVLVVLGGLLTPLGEKPLQRLFATAPLVEIDFRSLSLAASPNQYLVCPAKYCNGQAAEVSPAFEMTRTALRARWLGAVGREPRVELLARSGDGWQFDYLQRSRYFRFPDLITVRFIALAERRSSLAVYSRSIYGKSDFGVNRERIIRWLGLLAQERP